MGMVDRVVTLGVSGLPFPIRVVIVAMIRVEIRTGGLDEGDTMGKDTMAPERQDTRHHCQD